MPDRRLVTSFKERVQQGRVFGWPDVRCYHNLKYCSLKTLVVPAAVKGTQNQKLDPGICRRNLCSSAASPFFRLKHCPHCGDKRSRSFGQRIPYNALNFADLIHDAFPRESP